MGHYTSFLASLSSLVLMAAVYYCNYLSDKGSWLRSEMLQMILLSLLTGIFCLAVPATVLGVVGVLTGGLSLATLTGSGLEIASIAMMGLTQGNLSALAMEDLGHVAGLASSLMTAASTVFAVVLAVPVGLAFNGTQIPLMQGVGFYCALAFGLMRFATRPA